LSDAFAAREAILSAAEIKSNKLYTLEIIAN
jgi:hypothetical protein